MNLEAIKGTCLRFYKENRTRVHQAAAALLILLAHPRSNALFLLGLAVALAGETLRIWTAGHLAPTGGRSPQGPHALTRRPMHLGSFLIFCGFALACSSVRHWLFTLLAWAMVRLLYDQWNADALAVEANAQIPVFWPDRRSWRSAWESSRWNLAEVFKNTENKIFWVFLGVTLFLRLKMTYRF